MKKITPHVLIILLIGFSNQLFAQIISLDPSFNPPIIKCRSTLNNGNARITSIVQQPDGKLIVGGVIDSVNGTAVKGIVRLNTNGSVDPSFNFNPSTSYLTNFYGPKIILIEGGRMLVMGITIQIDSSRITRSTSFFCLNNDGAIYSGFHLGNHSNTKGFTVQNDGKIMVVGNFSYFYENGNYVDVAPGIIRLNSNGTRDLTFQAGSGFANLNTGGVWIDNITALSDGKYLVGGKFGKYNGNTVNNFLRINANGSFDSSFNIGSGFNSQTKKSIELPDGKYLIAGAFDQFNQNTAKKIVRINSNGSRDTSFYSGIPFNGVNEMLRKPNGKILVGYDVVFGVSGYPRGFIQLNENGTRDSTFNVGSGINYPGEINSICVQADNNVLVGGYFNSYNNIATNPIIRFAICDKGKRDTIFACNSYSWNGTVYSTSGLYTQTINESNGCSKVDTLQLYISSAIPLSPSITQTLISNSCGARIYRYTASSVTNATRYTWMLPSSVGGVSGVVVDSGNIDISRVIRLSYLSNEGSITGDSIRVKAISGCGESAIRSAKIVNLKLSVPSAPATITVNAIQTNVCGARTYRYSAPNLPTAGATTASATGYSWSLVGNLSSYGYSIDSGSLTSQRLIITFYSNLAAAIGDSIRLCYTSDCGNSTRKTLKLTNTLLIAPSAPATITVNAIQTNICGARTYRYSAPNLPTAGATTASATGYSWSLVGNLSSYGYSIDSGSLTSQRLIITFYSNLAAAIGDSIRLCYTSDCGNSTRKTLKLTNTLLIAPSAPATITVNAIQTNVCGARTYRYSAPNLPTAGATTASATGYSWSLVGNLSSYGYSIDSGSLTSQRLIITFYSNLAAAIGDSIRLCYTSDCGNSTRKTLKLTNTLLSKPSAPILILIQSLGTSVCDQPRYRYSAPNLPSATATTGIATGYEWELTGKWSFGDSAIIDSGTLNSQKLIIRFLNGRAKSIGDSIKCRYLSNCGIGTFKAATLTNIQLGNSSPTKPSSINITIVDTTICGGRKYKYTAPALSAANSYSSAATGYVWTLPQSDIGATLDSGSLNSKVIIVSFSNNRAAVAGDSIYLQFNSACGLSEKKGQKLSNLAKTNCSNRIAENLINKSDNLFSFDIFPNPSFGFFNIRTFSKENGPLGLRLLDIQGRCLLQKKIHTNENIQIGEELKPGVYFVELKKQNKIITSKIIKQY